jgi:hypothetical protein
VWLSNIGLISQNVVEGHSLPWIFIKDFFAVIKNSSGLLKSVTAYKKRNNRLRGIEAELIN